MPQAVPASASAVTPSLSSLLRRRIVELDGLRALAVLGVISFHYTVGTPLEFAAARLGWAGVDLFFVLSGFLITGILLEMRQRPHYFRVFYTRRILRIFPAYYLLLAVYFVCARVMGGPQPWQFWTMHAAFLSSTLGFFHSWNFPAPVFVYGGSIVLWSLSVEEQFYLFWAPVVKFLRPKFMAGLVAAMILVAPVLRVWLHRPWIPEYYFFPARMDSLAWGAAIALLLHHGEVVLQRLRRWLLPHLAGAMLLLAVLMHFTGVGTRENPVFAAFGYTLLSAIFALFLTWMVLHAGSANWLCRLMRQQPWQQIGKTSYMIYLIHYPLVFLAGKALGNRLGHGVRHTVVQDLTGFGLALLIAALSWRYFESPILRLKDRLAPRGEAALTAHGA